MRRLALNSLLALTLLWNGNAVAQQKPRLNLVVEELSADAARCGLTESSIKSVVTLTLQKNDILVATDQTGQAPYLSVWANAHWEDRAAARRSLAASPNLYASASAYWDSPPVSCILGLAVSVKANIAPIPTGSFKRKGGSSQILLCEQWGMGEDLQETAASYFAQNLAAQVELCLSQLEY